jgi:hypothetical protein
MDRSRILRFRVTPDEGAEVDRRAQSRGQSLSQYLRAAALDGVVFHDEVSKAVTTEVATAAPAGGLARVHHPRCTCPLCQS